MRRQRRLSGAGRLRGFRLRGRWPRQVKSVSPRQPSCGRKDLFLPGLLVGLRGAPAMTDPCQCRPYTGDLERLPTAFSALWDSYTEDRAGRS